VRAQGLQHQDQDINQSGVREVFFHAEQWLARPRDWIFPFFANPQNLEQITPGWLRFKVLTRFPMEMKVGVKIDYQWRVHGFPLRWTSEITVWEPPFRFIDEQRRGPYRKWMHEHRFEERDGGTLCIDNVRYAAPGGGWAHWLFVDQDVRRIFEFRRKRLSEILVGSPPPEPDQD